MTHQAITKNKPTIAPISLNWQDNSNIQGLLDVVVEIMAEEYIETARNNERVFSALETENTFTDPDPSIRPTASLGMTGGEPSVSPGMTNGGEK